MRVRLVGTWGADIEAREAGRDHLLMRAWSRPLKQPVECSGCHRLISLGWLREDGVYYCCHCVSVEGFELLCERNEQ